MAVLAIIFGSIFGVAAIAIVTEHFQKMARIRAEGDARGSRAVMDAINALRTEVRELRDTATEYDLSFDAALQRMESRVGHLEQRMNAAEQTSSLAGTGRS